jgi:hypothetical protein
MPPWHLTIETGHLGKGIMLLIQERTLHTLGWDLWFQRDFLLDLLKHFSPLLSFIVVIGPFAQRQLYFNLLAIAYQGEGHLLAWLSLLHKDLHVLHLPPG